MKYGIDRICPSLFAGKRVGLVTTAAARNAEWRSTIDVLRESASLTALFAPEHGIRGELAAGETVHSAQDPHTGLPVYSLYSEGGGIGLTKEMLGNIDQMVYDIPDVGTRYYTYLSTLRQILEACEGYGIEVMILDRPNPLGDKVEGPLLQAAFQSFVGAYPLCVRYGLTVGEYARMLCAQTQNKVTLHVIPCTGWRRSSLFPETRRHWIPPSPAIPSFETALLYPGTCLFEGTNLSEGRGTALPFTQIGAPYVDGTRLSEEMQRQALPGVQFLPVWFTPTAGKHAGALCSGVQLYITDRRSFSPFAAGTHLLFTIRRLYEESFQFIQTEKNQNFIDLLCGSDLFTRKNASAAQVLQQSETDSQQFAKTKQDYHLYDS